MKKTIYLLILIICFGVILPAQIKAASAKPAKSITWAPTTPEGYTPIDWVKARGIASFYKSQTNNGYLDYLTIIYLPYNEINLITSSTPQTVRPQVFSSFAIANTNNWVFEKKPAESSKKNYPDVKFIWNMPFFNITGTTTDLSLALKFSSNKTPFLTSGSRPEFDLAQNRRMLIVDNKNHSALISDFDENTFINNGDLAVEGFAPEVTFKGESFSISRLFVGVRPGNKELVIYCSKGASIEDAQNALISAGVPLENQLQADGGASATCGYNLPGHFFTEPGRSLPVLVGATPFLFKGTIINDGINVRNGPGIKNKAVDKLAKDTKIIAYEEKNGWVRIGTGQLWVLKTLIKIN